MSDYQRLKNIRRFLKLNQEEFANPLGLTQGGYSDVERGKNSISSKMKLNLKSTYSVNVHWLETGIGEMFAVSIEEENYENDIFKDDHQLRHLENEVKRLKNENLQFKTENRLYAELCAAKDKTIQALENQINTHKKIRN